MLVNDQHRLFSDKPKPNLYCYTEPTVQRLYWAIQRGDLTMNGISYWIWPFGESQAMVIMGIEIITKYGKRDGGCLAC